MKSTIEFSPAYTLLTLELSPGESIKAEPGAMAAHQGVEMKTGMGGGGLFAASSGCWPASRSSSTRSPQGRAAAG